MKKLFLSFVFASLTCYSQTPKDVTKPLSKDAFDKNIMREINFMVLGDNNIKQGFSYEYKEKNTELTLNANIQNFKSCIITADGEFSVDEGIYLFDESDGSKKARLSLNFFFPIAALNSKKFPALKNHRDSEKTTRMLVANRYKVDKAATKVVSDLLELDAIMTLLGIPLSEIEETERTVFNSAIYQDAETFVGASRELKEYYSKGINRDDSIYARLKKYFPKDHKYFSGATLADFKSKLAADAVNTTKYIRIPKVKNQATVASVTYSLPKDLIADKLFKDYNDAITKAENFEEDKINLEIKNVEGIWTVHNTNYVGISPFYERQGMDIYSFTGDAPTFGDAFTEVRGDLYGGRISYNYIRSYPSGKFIMARALGTVGRGSNFSEFSKKDYSYITNAVNIDNVPIQITDKKTAYTHKTGSAYQYGFVQKINLETYLSLANIGIYGKIGYEKNDILISQESYPFETGFMINLKSDKTSVVSLLLFVNRQNLNVHPDDDMNFGFKIGLPIFIRRHSAETTAATI